MKKTENEILYEVSKLYYIENRNQAEIARKMGISRPQVSRYLKKAKEIGIVEIKLNLPEESNTDIIADKLKNILGLKEVYITQKAPGVSNDIDRIKKLSFNSIKYISNLIENSKFVGIGWGRTIYNIILSMEYIKNKSDISFLPLIGGVGQTEPHYQVNTIVDRLAEKFGGNRIFLNAPAFFQKESFYYETLKNNGISTVLDLWEKLDLAIVGLGSPIQYSEVLRSEIAPATLLKLIKENPVGDILGRFINSKGQVITKEDDWNILGIPLECLQKIENVVCIAEGDEKTHGIISAAKSKYFNILITNYETGGNILSLIEGGLYESAGI